MGGSAVWRAASTAQPAAVSVVGRQGNRSQLLSRPRNSLLACLRKFKRASSHGSLSGQSNAWTSFTIRDHSAMRVTSFLGLAGTFGAHPQKSPPGSFVSFLITSAEIAGALIL